MKQLISFLLLALFSAACQPVVPMVPDGQPARETNTPTGTPPSTETPTATPEATVTPTETKVPFSPDLWKDAGTSKETMELQLTAPESIKTAEDLSKLQVIDIKDIISGKFYNSVIKLFKEGKWGKFPNPGKIVIFKPEIQFEGQGVYSKPLKAGGWAPAIDVSQSFLNGTTYNDWEKRPDLTTNLFVVDLGNGEKYVMFPTLWDTGDPNNPDTTINWRSYQYLVDTLNNPPTPEAFVVRTKGGPGVMPLPIYYSTDNACKYKAGVNYCSYWTAYKTDFEKWFKTWASTRKIPKEFRFFPISAQAITVSTH